jgi:hypothetical protein
MVVLLNGCSRSQGLGNVTEKVRRLALFSRVFESLRNLPADGQFDITVDAHVDNHWAVLDRESLVDFAEIGPSL